jgi:hypothetical protein
MQVADSRMTASVGSMMLPPGITDTLVLVQDDERQPPLLEVIVNSQTCLAAADDDRSGVRSIMVL